MPKPVYEEGNVTVLWNQAVHTDREFTANRPDIIIKNKKGKTCTLIDVTIPADGNVVQKEAEKKLKYKSLGIEIEMYDRTSNNWSHWNSNTELKEKSGCCTGNTFSRLFTKDGYTWNITHTAESTTV